MDKLPSQLPPVAARREREIRERLHRDDVLIEIGRSDGPYRLAEQYTWWRRVHLDPSGVTETIECHHVACTPDSRWGLCDGRCCHDEPPCGCSRRSEIA